MKEFAIREMRRKAKCDILHDKNNYELSYYFVTCLAARHECL